MKTGNGPVLLLVACAALVASPAIAATERDYQEQFCSGLRLEVVLENGARVDCMSDEYAIEVDFSDKWAEGLGQALLYSAATGLKPGIVLICRSRAATCAGHVQRLTQAIATWRLPVRLWLYSEDDLQ